MQRFLCWNINVRFGAFCWIGRCAVALVAACRLRIIGALYLFGFYLMLSTTDAHQKNHRKMKSSFFHKSHIKKMSR